MEVDYLKRKILIYSQLIKLTMKTNYVYRISFFAGMIGQWLNSGVGFLLMLLMINNFGKMAGWNANEVIFLYAYYLFTYALAAFFFNISCTNLEKKIRTGEFELDLIRPCSVLGYEVFSNLNFGYISHIILSAFFLVYSVGKIDVNWSLFKIVELVIFILGSILLQGSIIILASVTSFYMFYNNPIINFVITELRNFLKYPLCIYGKLVMVGATIIPIAFINYYPVVAFLNKQYSYFFLGYFTPLIGGILFIISIRCWNRCVMHYEGAGA